MFATKDIKAGDVILAEKPLAVGYPPKKFEVVLETRNPFKNPAPQMCTGYLELENKLLTMVNEESWTPMEKYKLSLLYDGKNGKDLMKLTPSMNVFYHDVLSAPMKSYAQFFSFLTFF